MGRQFSPKPFIVGYRLWAQSRNIDGVPRTKQNQGLFCPDPEETLLPCPCLSFAPARGPRGLEFLGLFGGKTAASTLIAGVDYRGGGASLAYDVRDGVVRLRPMASPHDTKFSDPVSVAVGQALYVMDKEPVPGTRCCFEVLELSAGDANQQRWEWRRLRSPPFVSEYNRYRIQSYALVGGSSIWVSAPGAGTHAFDTGTGAWSKAGDWELPFQGRADFFPELAGWLGFSARDGWLCCCSSALEAMAPRAPGLDALLDDLHLPGKWTPLESRLVPLGPGGRFCLAIMYERVDKVFGDVAIPQVERCVVFTGLVLKRGGDGGEGLQLTTHKSRLYRLQASTRGWVF